MAQDDDVSSCGECGASVYPEHLDSGIARYEGDKLLCSHCVAELDQADDDGMDDDFEPIVLESQDEEEDDTVSDMSSTRISTMGGGTLGAAGGWDDARFDRTLEPKTATATRCRTFHSKLSEGAIEFLNSQINEWLDKNDNIRVKFANSTIGLFEGKHSEQNLILTLFY